jgi:menaquinone-dependent protoporphyrinogen oxidase
MDLLVAYASDHGSTQGVAERLACRLRIRGIEAQARSVTAVESVAGYDGVVLGSAVHGGSWLAEATWFADRNAADLRRRPTWLFSVSTVGDEESMYPRRVAKRLRREPTGLPALRDTLRCRGHRSFAGAIARSDWPSIGRLFFRAVGGRYGDHRTWPPIDAWADAIAEQLSASPAVGAEGDQR